MSDTTNTPRDITYGLTREDWLHRAAEELGKMIFQVSGMEMPKFHVSMGFGGQRYERGVRGVCWRRHVSDDGLNHVFISPELKDTGVVLAVLLHELIHVVDDCEHGHGKVFAEIATRLGLKAPFTTATPDIELTGELMVIAAELGEFPHAALNVSSRRPVEAPTGDPILVGPGGGVSSAPKPQTNRWFVFKCPTHKAPIRMSRGQAAHGAPFCGHRDEQGIPCLKETVPADQVTDKMAGEDD